MPGTVGRGRYCLYQSWVGHCSGGDVTPRYGHKTVIVCRGEVKPLRSEAMASAGMHEGLWSGMGWRDTRAQKDRRCVCHMSKAYLPEQPSQLMTNSMAGLVSSHSICWPGHHRKHLPESVCRHGIVVACCSQVVALLQSISDRCTSDTLLHKALPMGIKQPDQLARCYTHVPWQAVDAVSKVQHPRNACTSVVVQRVLELHLQHISTSVTIKDAHLGEPESGLHTHCVGSKLADPKKKQGLVRGLCSLHAHMLCSPPPATG